jgi:hypothetical protein
MKGLLTQTEIGFNETSGCREKIGTNNGPSKDDVQKYGYVALR